MKNAPAVIAPADLRKSLLVVFMIVDGLNNLIFKDMTNTFKLIYKPGIFLHININIFRAIKLG